MTAAVASRSVPSESRDDRIAGRPLSPRTFRSYGIESLLLGPPATQSGLARRAGVALWRRLPEHAALFDRVTGEPGEIGESGDAGPPTVIGVRVVVATARGRDRSLRVPAVGPRAERVAALAEEAREGGGAALPPVSGCLLLVDEGPGETWLYLAAPADPEAALEEFLGRRGRTDFARALRRTRLAGMGGVGVVAAPALVVYAQGLGMGVWGYVIGALVLGGSLALLAAARPR